MPRRRRRRQTQPTGAPQRLGVWLRSLGLSGLLVVVGCATDNGNRTPLSSTPAVDPLLGGPPVAGRPIAQPTSSNGSTTPSTPSTSPASLAPRTGGGEPSSLDPNGGIRIRSSAPTSPTVTAPPASVEGWHGAPAGPTPSVPPSPPPAPERPQGGGFSLFGNRSADINPLLASLRQRGATFQRLETWGNEGEWKFSCSIPNRQNPHIRRTYEAKAADPLLAVRAVIDQVDKEQR